MTQATKNILFAIACSFLSLAFGTASAQRGNSIDVEQGPGYSTLIVQEGSGNSIILKQVDSNYYSEGQEGKPSADIKQKGSDNKIDVVQANGRNGEVLSLDQSGSNNLMKVYSGSHITGGKTEITQAGINNGMDVDASSFRSSTFINQAGAHNSINAKGGIYVVQASSSSNSSVVSDGSASGSLTALQEGANQKIISNVTGGFGDNKVKQFVNASGAIAEVSSVGLNFSNIEQYGEGAYAYAETGAYGDTSIIQRGKNNIARVKNPGLSIIRITQDAGSDGSEANVETVWGRSETTIFQDGSNNLSNINIGAAGVQTNVQQFNGNNKLYVLGNLEGGVINVTQRGGSSASIVQR